MELAGIILEILRAIASWVAYRYSPDEVAIRRKMEQDADALKAHDQLSQALAYQRPMSIAAFVSERLRLYRAANFRGPTDKSDGLSGPVLK